MLNRKRLDDGPVKSGIRVLPGRYQRMRIVKDTVSARMYSVDYATSGSLRQKDFLKHDQFDWRKGNGPQRGGR